MKWLMKIETGISMFFFVLSWMVCAAWFALKAGYVIAQAGSDEKQEFFKKIKTKE